MTAFLGRRISPNQTKTPDEFLVAHNVPISRSGWFQYLGREIGLDSDDLVNVYRPPEELFNPGTMASFEGKPFVDGHPPRGVTPENATRYIKGSVQNVRRGADGESDLLLADINVYDRQTIDEITSGKREVSAGFDFDRKDNGDGTYRQIDIVGNHVALVPKGRAGERVRINDSHPDTENEESAKKYGILVKPKGHRSPPEGYSSNREDYADPVNFKYPLTDGHAKSAVVYFNRSNEREDGGYSPEEWDKIGHRIVHKLGDDYELKNGQIVTLSKAEDETPMEETSPLHWALHGSDEKQKGADSKMKLRPPSRKQSRMTDWLAAIGLKQFAQDAEPDEIQEAVDAMAEEKNEEVPEDGTEVKPEEKKIEGVADENAPNAALEAKVDKLTELVNKLLAGKTETQAPEDAIDAEIDKLEKESGSNSEESHTIPVEQVGDENLETPVTPPEERPQSGTKALDSAYKIAALKAMKPILASIPDPVTRQKASDEAIKSINGIKTSNAYEKIAQANRAKAADAAAKAKQTQDQSQIGKDIAKSRNPHYQNRK